MSDQNKNDRLLGQGAPRAHALNKKLIIVVGVILMIFIVAIFFLSIDRKSDKRVSQSSLTAALDDGNANASTSSLKTLPAGYQDRKEIDKLLGRNPAVKMVENPAAKKELQMMQTTIDQMRSQLTALQKQPKPAPPQPIRRPSQITDPMQTQAAVSNIFVPGAAPRPTLPNNANADNSTKKTKKEQEKDLKKAFLEGKPDEKVTNQNTIQKPISKYTISAGDTIPSVLYSTLNTSNPGYIIARVTHDVYDSLSGEYLMIPKGSKLIGEYNASVSYGDTRLQAKFIRLIRPDGTSIVLNNQVGVDGEGVSGFSDEVNNHWGQLIGAAALTTIFNVPAVAANYAQQASQQYNPQTGYGQPSLGSTMGNAALSSLGTSVTQVGSKVTERAMNVKPTIIIHSGYEFNVFVSQDLILPPYLRVTNA